MQRGKYKCKHLKAVRKRIAEENGIALEQRECTYEGPCRGTCPYCEAEVRYLERSLADRIRLGKAATVAGLGLSLAACGGQTSEGVAPRLTTDSSLADDSMTDTLLADSLPPGTQRTEPEVMDIPNVGELEIMGEPPPLPPPPAPGEYEAISSPDDTLDEEGGEVRSFAMVDEEPVFPGGIDALKKFISDNIQYPQKAKDNNVSGKVYVTFVVESDGRISNPRLLRDIGGGCGEEALRVVKSLPRWTPGKLKGKPIRVQYNLPVSFELK